MILGLCGHAKIAPAIVETVAVTVIEFYALHDSDK